MLRLLTRRKPPWSRSWMCLARCKPALGRVQVRLASSNGVAPKRATKSEDSTLSISLKDTPHSWPEAGDVQHDESVHGGWPTVLQQVQDNMRKYSHCVVLTRVGNFYELYFEQASEYGPLLGIKLASKKARDTRVAMAGFPFYQLDRYLKILVQDFGKSVAISEEELIPEAERIKHGGLKNTRSVRRVVTPGTLIDEHFLSPFEHNYLLALDVPNAEATSGVDEGSKTTLGDRSVGLTWLDLSSGDFITQTSTIDGLSSTIARIGPREVLLRPDIDPSLEQAISAIVQAGDQVLTKHALSNDVAAGHAWSSLLSSQLSTGTATSFSAEETSSSKLLLDYVTSHLPGLQLKLQAPIQRFAQDFMTIDRNSLRGLEILRTSRDGMYKGSLLHAVRRTSTESGARLLAQRLVSPSASPVEINNRLDLVDVLVADEAFLDHLVALLHKTSDALRLVQRFSLGRGEPDDLLRLSETINITNTIKQSLYQRASEKNDSMKRLSHRFDAEGPTSTAHRIVEAIDEEGLDRRHQSEETEEAEASEKASEVLDSAQQTGDLGKLQKRVAAKRTKKNISKDDGALGLDDIWIMKRTTGPSIAKLHDHLDSLRQEKADLAESLRSTLGATSLSLKFTPGLGHICHITGKDTKLDLTTIPQARTVSSSKSTRSFYHPHWTTLGHRIEDAKLRLRAEEQATFKTLRDAVIDNLIPLRRNASLLDELDVACSSARLALELNLKRPILNHSSETKISKGRHIMVDKGLDDAGRHFTPNDCHLTDPERIWLITGPNMAGKSTFLRQTALISILAQTGSFVPAHYAEIGLVDQIFSRVGSADSLSQDQSTFMVEMLETAQILRHATRRSFVIMDEVGRGTTPEDGLAVGYAVLEHLRGIGCRTLFATHFHGLASEGMTGAWPEVGTYCTDVREDEDGEGGFRYDHRMRRGVNRESHALKVARLAGMSEGVVRSAERVLEGWKGGMDDGKGGEES